MHLRVLILFGIAAVVGGIAAPATAQLQTDLADLLPDGDTRPVVVSVELKTPARHNDLLEADLVIEAIDNDGISRYEYRWNRAGFGIVFGDTKITTVSSPTVSYETVTPNTPRELQVRAIDVNGWASDWYSAWRGTTPPAPNVIVAGDSIASGYTRQWFSGRATCRDNDLSYGAALTRGVAARLPPAWAPTYTNIAWAGAGIGNMINGGTDSCGDSHPSQLDQIDRLADDATWNIVAVTAGINSTNWTNVVVGLTKDTAFSLTDRGDKNVCKVAVRDKWNIDEKRSYLASRSTDVSEALSLRTNADLYWTGYYDITNTELAPRWKPIGNECRDEMNDALGQLHTAIKAGLTDTVTWVDIDVPISTQKWAGWPHPNAEGQSTIATQLLTSIDS